MRHIENKNDWFYEFKPQLMMLFGMIGLFSNFLVPIATEAIAHRTAQACGIVLLVLAIKILDWRKTYRETARQMLRARRS
ncbi:MAG: hypothetical protein ACXWC9_04060 [Pseudobdellovibrionaceae bacterium]